MGEDGNLSANKSAGAADAASQTVSACCNA